MTSHSRQAGGGTLFTEPILVVNQQAKPIEAANGFGVFDQYGQPLGAVVKVGHNLFRKAIRVLPKYDKYVTHKFEVRDMGGSVVLKVTRPAKLFNSGFVVTRADETPIGEIVQENEAGRIRFAFTANGRPVGAMQAENWRAWDFSITDHDGTEVARVTKTFSEVLLEAFTAADNYVVEMHRHLSDPLASMVVASALTIDSALKQGGPE
jgi:hypothetical protein